MKYPRAVAGTIRRDRIRNTDIRKQLNVIPVQERRQQGHIIRTDNNRKVKAIWKARNDEKGKSRRPTRTCNSEIGKLLKQRVKNWREKMELCISTR
jgi:hypothetical protein